MHVQRVVVPGNQAGSWTVLDDDGRVVEPIERWLAHLTAVERSPNTVKAYSHDLKDYLVFLASRGLDWREVRLEDIGAFVAWLRLPAEGRDGSVAVLPGVAPKVTESTVNRKLSAINAFYCFHARHGMDVGELLVTWQAPGRGGGRGGYRPFLHHITKGSPQPRRTMALKGAKKLPRILTPAEVQAVLDACVHLRDRFLFALLYDSGCRIGEALGLRHEDIDAASRVLRIQPRTNSNGARVKNHSERSVPISGQLVRLWGDYLHEEYGDLDCDYVFVNLFAAPRGQAMTYSAAYDLVVRLRARAGFDFDPHWLRHCMATRALRDGVPLEVVSKLLGHSSTTVTEQVYGHLTIEDARKALEAAGWFSSDGAEVTL